MQAQFNATEFRQHLLERESETLAARNQSLADEVAALTRSLGHVTACRVQEGHVEGVAVDVAALTARHREEVAALRAELEALEGEGECTERERVFFSQEITFVQAAA